MLQPVRDRDSSPTFMTLMAALLPAKDGKGLGRGSTLTLIFVSIQSTKGRVGFPTLMYSGLVHLQCPHPESALLASQVRCRACFPRPGICAWLLVISYCSCCRATGLDMAPGDSTGEDPNLDPGGITSYSLQAVPHDSQVSSSVPFIVTTSFCFSFTSISPPLTCFS